MKNLTRIRLNFDISDDNPLKKEVFNKFSELMKLLQEANIEKRDLRKLTSKDFKPTEEANCI